MTGGARSGKSRFALERAEIAGGDAVTFIATAEGLDQEMELRIGRHREERNPAWRTIEAPRSLAAALAENAPHREERPGAVPRGAATRVLIVDCLSLWVSNLMLDGIAEADIVAEARKLTPPASGLLIVVTNEVGLGIVPDNALARAYRDVLGRVNQTVASAATEAYLLVSGLPLRLK